MTPSDLPAENPEAIYDAILRRHSRPAAPLPTQLAPRIKRLPGIRAVLFDVYGTLLVSASGDVGTAGTSDQGEAMREALRAAGVPLAGSAVPPSGLLEATIRRHHERSREQGIDYPEVDIVQIWRDMLQELARAGLLAEAGPGDELAADVDPRQLAVEYEVRANPTWPMPDLIEALDRLRRDGLLLGIVSNAQFFTPRLFPALVGRELADLGFDANLQYYSYRYGRAKPSEFLYRRAEAECRRRSIAPGEVLYVGNDLLNDVWPASRVGFRTALFAGDRRSLRLREQDERVAGVRPDVVVADLNSLADCL